MGNERAAQIADRNEARTIIANIAFATEAQMERLFHLGYAEAYVNHDEGYPQTAFRLNDAGQALHQELFDMAHPRVIDESLDGNDLPF